MEPTRQPELLAPGEGRPIRIGGDVLLVKALTGLADGLTGAASLEPEQRP